MKSWGGIVQNEVSGRHLNISSHGSYELREISTAMLLSLVMFLIVYKITQKYNERRLMVISLTFYTIVLATCYILSLNTQLPLLHEYISLSVECFLQITRVFIMCGSIAFVVKVLTHDIPSATILVNAPFILGVYQAISETYSLEEQPAVYLGISLILLCGVIRNYGHLRVRFMRRTCNNFMHEVDSYRLLI